MLSIESIAQQMYDAYGGRTDYEPEQQRPFPVWEQLPPEIQAAWVAAATKARELLATEVVAPS